MCECGRATRAIARRQSHKPVARLREQGPEHAYYVITAESKQFDWLGLAGRKKVEVNPTSKINRAIADDLGIFILETNYACPDDWSRARATKFGQVETRLKGRNNRLNPGKSQNLIEDIGNEMRQFSILLILYSGSSTHFV